MTTFENFLSFFAIFATPADLSGRKYLKLTIITYPVFVPSFSQTVEWLELPLTKL
jgi:hypothetical protein